jgi:hypothetical protein
MLNISRHLYHHAVDPNAYDHNLVWTYIISTKRKYHYRNHSNGWILKHVNNNVFASTLQFHTFHDIHPLVSTFWKQLDELGDHV